MNEQLWRDERDNRTLRYAGRRLDPNRWLLLSVEPSYAARYDGQVAVLTAANLLGRMTPALALDIPNVQIVSPLPWAGRNLREFIQQRLYEADPYGRFELRIRRAGDSILRFGSADHDIVVHGSGWNTYIGPGPSPLSPCTSANPIGPAMAAIIAAANLFIHDCPMASQPLTFNTLFWNHDFTDSTAPVLPMHPDLGELWTVGTGSVGTAILYFLTLTAPYFSTILFDGDIVKIHNLDRSPIFIHNLDRSPIFINKHVGQLKADAVKEYLEAASIANVISESCTLDIATQWACRPAGRPDMLISAANERNVRSIIESSYPPIQIYGTTGRNWQASVIRHIPIKEPCSCCLFPETSHVETTCATGKIPEPGNEQQVDAALPFLSFAAGAMAAAEILKVSMPDLPYTSNRTMLYTSPLPRIVNVSQVRRPDCICKRLSTRVHRQMIQNSKYATLSGTMEK
ncbi:MAG: ThiF family adenylyltransferase [Nitrospirae bacterium]|nr:ThiF family adenylyltransferase [Nitrospirota bacterium]